MPAGATNAEALEILPPITRTLKELLSGEPGSFGAGTPPALHFSGSRRLRGVGCLDEELVVCGKCVLWLVNGLLRLQCATSLAVLDVAWCRIQRYNFNASICVLHHGFLAIHGQDGDCQVVALSEPFTKLWPLPQGVLLTGESPVLPHVLSDQEEDLIAVAFFLDGGCDQIDERVVWSSLQAPYIATYNQSCERLSIWRLPLRHQSLTTFASSPPALHNILSRTYEEPSHLMPASAIRPTRLRQCSFILSPLMFEALPRGPFHSSPVPQLWHRAPPIQLNSYQQVLMTHCPDEGCLAHDADGHGDGDGKRSWSLSGVISAAAVAATRQYALGMHDCMPPHDLLILHSSGRLALHIGQRMICYVAAKLEEPPAHEDVVGAANLALLHGGTVSSEVSTDQLNWRVGHLYKNVLNVRTSLSSDLTSSKVAAGVLDGYGLAATATNPLDTVQLLGEALECSSTCCARIQSSVDDRVSLGLATDVSQHEADTRVVLAFTPVGHRSKAVLRALQVALPEATWATFQAALLSNAGAVDGDCDLEWVALHNLVTATLRANPLDVAASPQPPLPLTPFLANSGTFAPVLSTDIYDSWEALSVGAYHERHCALFPWKAPSSVELTANAYSVDPSLGAVLRALHAVYEDCKLNVLHWRYLSTLRAALKEIAVACGFPLYCEYYQAQSSRLFPTILESRAASGLSTACMRLNLATHCKMPLLETACEVNALAEHTPLDVCQTLGELLSLTNVDINGLEKHSFEGTRTRDIMRCYAVLRDTVLTESPGSVLKLTGCSLAEVLYQSGWTVGDLDSLPTVVGAPLLQALQLSTSTDPDKVRAYAAILYRPAFKNSRCKLSALSDIAVRDSLFVNPASCTFYNDIEATQRASAWGRGNLKRTLHVSRWHPRLTMPKPSAALPYVQRLLRLRSLHKFMPPGFSDREGVNYLFPACLRDHDMRLWEVRRLLATSCPFPLSSRAQSSTAAEAAQQLQAILQSVATRRLALPIGCGAFTLGTSETYLVEPLATSALCLSGQLREQNNAVVDLESSGSVPAPGGGARSQLTAWPEFHNGAATALRLLPAEQQDLRRTWIAYNKPEEPSYSHAGLLMALGLTGHLYQLPSTDLYRYLSQEHDATIVGALLGVSASQRSTMDATVTKMLLLHLPAHRWHPELEVAPIVQSAALLGVGLLYQGSNHRSIVNFLLREIGRCGGASTALADPTSLFRGVTKDREVYALSAGMSLGLVTLGRGRHAFGMSDVLLEDKLRYLVLGTALSNGVTAHCLPVACGFDAAHWQGGGAFAVPSGLEVTQQHNEPHDSRNAGAVAQELAAAQGAAQVVREGDRVDRDVTSLAASFALGLMYLHTNDTAVASLFLPPDCHYALQFIKPEELTVHTLLRGLIMCDFVRPSTRWIYAQLSRLLRVPMRSILRYTTAESENDWQAVGHAHCCGLSGACLALGIHYAGTADYQAASTLKHFLHYFLRLKLDVHGVSWSLSHELLESCAGTTALALSLVMAGTCDLATFKLFRGMSKRCSNVQLATTGAKITHGAHMAVGMSVGFLFLGAGSLTFQRGRSSVAYLAISVYPFFPESTNDNRLHLQALRHLYVLAVRRRESAVVQSIEAPSIPDVNGPASDVPAGRMPVVDLLMRSATCSSVSLLNTTLGLNRPARL